MVHKTKDIHHLPPDDTPSGWVDPSELSTIGSRAHHDRVTLFDWTVVGAGFTGLAAARRLAELNPNDTVALIDAKPVGWGASGRNSGFIIDLPHKFDLDSDDADRLSAIMRLNSQAITDLEGHVKATGIECGWSPVGKLQGAVRERGTGKMRTFVKALEKIGQPYTKLDRAQVAQIIGTDYYAGAIHTPGCVLMNPVRLTRGLARSLPKNVTLFDGCPVVRFERESRGFGLTLRSRGTTLEISTSSVLMCTNAFTPEFGLLKNRIVPVITFASMTRPLSDSEMEAYGGQLDWGLTPADPGGTTLRMTQDRRLLVRNQYDYAGHYGVQDRSLEGVRQKHRGAFDKRYPQLKKVPFDSTWGGVCGLSRNHVSYFGEIESDVWNSSCHNGVGVARGTISGRLLAEAASGQSSPMLQDMFAVSNTPSLNPPDPFLGLGVRARLKLAAWESKEEI
ncbi:NAD(P)/FAD-dependent oxidoreductase [Litoreibacter albidus]|uniref:NAD(P)/FAD-dependent oxidoreductase n=1 Tax=Litoreibacter albidus TaxID=670155 RepID=UPI003736769E